MHDLPDAMSILSKNHDLKIPLILQTFVTDKNGRCVIIIRILDLFEAIKQHIRYYFKSIKMLLAV